jgi:hypothetical protein
MLPKSYAWSTAGVASLVRSAIASLNMPTLSGDGDISSKLLSKFCGQLGWRESRAAFAGLGASAEAAATSLSTLLANVNPAFNWVRLAQRIPVRIKLDNPSSDIRLTVDRTATVLVGSSDGGR